jgi:AcrR family transcriptional regulator
LFVERGFPAVKMENIAEAAGVTARALYRHYDNKAALLAQAIMTSQDQFLSAGRAARVGDDAHPLPITRALPGLVESGIANRDLTVLWQREARYLSSDDRRRVRQRINEIVSGIHASIATEFPVLSPAHAELRAWGVSSTLTSLGFHSLTLPRSELSDLLVAACAAVVRTPPVSELEQVPDSTSVPLTPGPSRREGILAAAAAAFAERGFPTVTNADIAGQVGIAGPGLYRYFTTKQEILDSLARRRDEWVGLEHRRALGGTDEPVGSLRHLLQGYLRVCTDAPDLVTLTVAESAYLSQDVLDVVARNREDREAEWIDRLRRVEGDVDTAEARLLLAASLGFLEDMARTPRLWARSGVREEMVEIALSILCRRPVGGSVDPPARGAAQPLVSDADHGPTRAAPA